MNTQNEQHSLTTKNVTLAAGALAAFQGELVAITDRPGASLTFQVSGLPQDFNAQLARGTVRVDLRELLLWVDHLLSLNREAKKRGGVA